MGKDKTPKFSMFHRLKEDIQSKPTIFTKIKTNGKSSNPLLAQERNPVFNRLGQTREVQSSIPLHIKCILTLGVKTNDSLKVNRCTIVMIDCKVGSNSKEIAKEEEQASSNHVTVQEINQMDADIKMIKAPEILEDGGASHN